MNRRVCTLLFALGAGGLAGAQGARTPGGFDWPNPQSPQQPGAPLGAGQAQALQRLLQGGGALGGVLPGGGQPFRQAQPFPTFPTGLPGFGQFPLLGAPTPFSGEEAIGSGEIVPVLDPNAWPSWIKADAAIKAEEGFLPDRAILSRSSERVWYLAPTASAYVPLAFHDKFRLVTPGCKVEVRGRGEFQVLFHGGATLRSRQSIKLSVESLSQDAIRLRLDGYRYVWITARSRPIYVELDSGETVTVKNTLAYFESDGDLASIKHAGTGTLAIEGEVGTVELPPAHRISVLAAANRTGSSPGELAVAGDVTSVGDGRILRAEGGAAGGAVVWNGARFALQPGNVLRLDPLAGDSFPNNRPDNQ